MISFSLQSTFHDLFEVDTEEADAAKRMAAVLGRPKAEDSSEPLTAESPGLVMLLQLLLLAATIKLYCVLIQESALAADEDETDVAAGRIVRAEVAAELLQSWTSRLLSLLKMLMVT